MSKILTWLNFLLWDQVGQDVVAELTAAMDKQGLDMRVAALVCQNLWCLSTFARIM